MKGPVPSEETQVSSTRVMTELDEEGRVGWWLGTAGVGPLAVCVPLTNASFDMEGDFVCLAHFSFMGTLSVA